MYRHPNLNLFMGLQSIDFMMGREQEKNNKAMLPEWRESATTMKYLSKKKRSKRGPKQDLSNGSRNCGDYYKAMVWAEIIETWLVSKYSSTYI